jgi:NDP-sugar pyrophosphorylase family protein
MVQGETLTNWVVLMAGGEGKRLRPATDNCPKPMLKVGGMPILEIILQQCIKSGFRNYFISVNYLKEQIMEYFGDGSYWGVNIQYLEENQPLGTAGALSQLHKTLTQTLLVINGDVLTRADYRSLLRFHREQNASVTLCVHEDETRIPYGVVTSKDYQMETIQEKPVISHNIIAGIYALEPDMLKLLPSNQFCDMPDLIEMGKEQCKSVFVFPIHEYWLDIGHPAALDMANGEWGRSDE